MLRNGDLDAKMHGINSTVLRYVVIVVSTIITALSVCISGTIGWIGLAIPNLMRIFVSNDSKRLMPLTIDSFLNNRSRVIVNYSRHIPA